jgi:hypothetical protein
MVVQPTPAYPGETISTARTNADFLAWFAEEERQTCTACNERSRVTVPEAVASFCLACGAVWLDGVRIDVDRRPLEPPRRRWPRLLRPRKQTQPRPTH